MLDNKYFLVTGTKTVWVKTGSIPGNSYYGASRIYDVCGVELTLHGGDELHKLVGGLFAIKDGVTFEVLYKSPAAMNMHFCHDYTPRSWYEDNICSKDTVEIPKAKAHIPAKYA